MDQVRFNEVLSLITKKGDTHIDCSSLRLNDEQIGILVSAMESSPVGIKNLNLSSNAITDAGATALAGFLKKHPVEEVFLTDNKIGDSGASEFLQLFEVDEGHPINFDIRGNQCAESLVVRLTFLAKSRSLNKSIKQALFAKRAESVTFVGLKYSDIDLRLIRFMLHDVEDLVSVDLSLSACGDSGIVAIGEALKDSKIKSLSARRCNVGSVGLSNFIEACGLPTHAYLESLDFSENTSIGNDIGMQIPNLVFNTNTALKKWSLAETSLSTESRAVIETECDLNNQPAVLKAAVVALRIGSEAAREINLQWEKDVSQCMVFLWRTIRDSDVIETLNISNAGISDDAVELLCSALNKNTSLRVINLANNKITAAGIATLFAQIERGKCGVQEINLANNDLADDCATPIISCLRTNPNVRVINVDVNPRLSQDYVNEIGGLVLINQSPPALRTLLPAVEKNVKTLTEIDLSAKDVTYNDECVRMLCQALMFNSIVTKLNFSSNIIGDIGAVYIAELLASNATIKEIDLSNNSIGNRGAQKICEALRLNKTLKILKLDNNVLDGAGVSDFQDMLRTNHFMSVVSLERTRVPVETAVLIQRACDINRESPEVKAVFYRLHDSDSTLTEIDLSEAKRQWALDDMSVQTLCAVLIGQDFVKRVAFQGNNIGSEGCKHLSAVLAHENCKIAQVDLSRNPIGDDGFVALSQAFPANKVMDNLDVRETGITNAGCDLVVPAMKQNDVILSIALDEGLSGPGFEALSYQLTLNNEPIALKHLLLRLEGGEVIDEVDLHGMGEEPPFSDNACRVLCEAFMKNTSLRSINLSQNKITSKSTPFMTDLIESCPKLAFVDVSNNGIEDKGADLMIACLEETAHIRALTVLGNPMHMEKQERIAQLLAMNLSSQKLKKVLLQHSRGERLDEALDFNGKHTGYYLNDEEVQVLAQILRDVKEVRALDLGNNQFGDRGCIAIAEVLRANHSIQALYLDMNPEISVPSGDALFYALKINPQVHTLELTGTRVPKQILEDIDSLLHVNQTAVTDKIDMRATKISDVDDQVQFKSTDYYMAQEENLEAEALERCKRTEQLLLE